MNYYGLRGLRSLLAVFSAAVLLLLGPDFARADWYGRITKIIDGDIMTLVTDDNRVLTFRLFAVDCPEPGQPYAEEARELVRELVLDNPKLITVLEEVRDQVGQALAVVVLADGTTLNDRLLIEGLAWFDTRICGRNPFCEGMMELERQARMERRGLWADDRPVPPWEARPAPPH
jgi:endonuclease YncB( thermonuclease family)